MKMDMGGVFYQKAIDAVRKCDVLVVGTGPAGACAAVAAARLGARTAAIERYGSLGGNLTVGHVGPIMGSVAKGTMRDELAGLLGVGFNDIQGAAGRVHDMERAKRVFADCLNGAGVDVCLQTQAVDAIVGDGRVKGVVAAGKRGLSAIMADVVVDATGDGDVAYFAGEDCRIGREDGETQPVTLMYLLAGVDETRAITCIGEEDAVELNGERFLDFTARCAREGLLPENSSSVRLYKTLEPGERLVNATQANHVDGTKAEELIGAEVELRGQIDQITRFLQERVPGYERCRIKSTAGTLGVRETRRVVGEYVLTDGDLRAGRRFADVAVHDANFVVDIHNPNGGGQAEGLAEVVKPYDIPYRCLIPAKLDGLIVTGRCISGTHRAHASYRIASVCMALGEAAGIAAALSRRHGVAPRRLDASLLQAELTRRGVRLFD